MSKESELDKIFGKRDEQITEQGKILVLPGFLEKEIAEGISPITKVSKETIPIKERETRVQTNISQIEVIYPWLLHKQGVIKGDLPQWEKSGSKNNAAQIGIALHEADAIFNCVFQEVGESEVRDFFPYHKDDTIEPIVEAISAIEQDEHEGEEEFVSKLLTAWDMFVDASHNVENSRFISPAFAGMGVETPTEK